MRRKVIVGSALVTILAVGTLGGGVAAAFSMGGDDNIRRGNIESSSVDDSNVKSTSVETTETERETETREEQAPGNPAGIGLEEARQSALEARRGEVTKVELEEEHGYQIYEVEVAAADGNEYELSVDATDGDILAQEIDDRDDDDRDRDDDSDDRDDDGWDDDGNKGEDD